MFIPNLAILATAVILLTPSLVSANLLKPLPPRAALIDLWFQPVLDFDKDACYHVAAVDANGNTNEGLDPSKSSITDCRAEAHLYHSNAYSRHMCNHGWCAVVYAYYFEMDSIDTGFGNKGHRHDWEHVVVWVKDKAVKYVATSAHGLFDTHSHHDVHFQGNHPKIVVHKDWKLSRNMRLAKEKDDDIENHFGEWFQAHLVDWSGFPSYYARDQLVNKNYGSAHMQFKDDQIGGLIAKSIPSWARDEGFDSKYDDGSWSF